MDRTFIRRFYQLEREVGKIKIQERLRPETMGLSSGIGATGLRGLWPMSSVDSGGNAMDISGHNHTLTYNGDPVFGYDSTSPHVKLDGVGDYLSRADEADLDITGTESYIDSTVRGLTVWSWVYFDNVPAADEGIITKWDTGAQRSYQIFRDATGDLNFHISSDGTIVFNVQIATSLAAVDTWYFVAGRFTPANELKCWVNTETNTNVTAIPAAIYSSTADLHVGAINGASLMTGRIGYSGLCASLLSDKSVGTIFEMTRGIYGI